MNILKILLILFVVSFSYVTDSLAFTLHKVKKNKVLIKKSANRLEKGDILYVLDSDGSVKGKIKIYKRKKKRAYGKIIEGKGRIEKGDQADFEVPSQATSNSLVVPFKGGKSGQMGVTFVAGMLMGSNLDSAPTPFGGSFFYHYSPRIVIRVGGVYWLVSPEGLNITLMSYGIGGGYQMGVLSNMLLELGARAEMASLEVESVAKTSNFSSTVISPYVSLHYPMSKSLSFGMEIQYPIYMDEAFKNTKGQYVFGAVQYKF